VSNAYLREDKSFRIELLRPGKGGIPVIVTNGFLTEGDNERWGGWRSMVDARYPDSPVYRVRWGAKELRDFGVLGAGLAGKVGGVVAVKGAAAMASKAGAQFLGRAVAPAILTADLAKNPWHVAKNRADKTGVVVGDLLARTEAEAYVLIGHSLGARVMVVAAEALGTKPGGPRIQAAHLLGAAIGARSNWDALTAAVDEAVYGYHSVNDNVLKFVYRTVQGGQAAAGYEGFSPAATKLVNVDVSESVKTHFDYQDSVQLM
jgi:pimeloyl-ACP methyl ester carboxylesterase